MIARLARRQRGVVGRRQLLDAGIGSGAIKQRIRSGRLHAVHRGVYLVGHAAPMELAHEVAAVLVCGRGAVVSHLSAAVLWRLLPRPDESHTVDVTVPGRELDSRPGIRIHFVAAFDPLDVRKLNGIPVTSPTRTLLDIAATEDAETLERAAANAQALRLTSRRSSLDQLARNPGRRGSAAFRRLIESDHPPARTRSEAERLLLRLIRAAELPPPRVNARLGRFEVDFLWPDQRLVVEVDGYAYHSDRASFERDRRRDATLSAAGYLVIRVTWRQVKETPEAVVARLASALAARSRLSA